MTNHLCPQVEWELDGNGEHCSRLTLTFYLGAPAWKQFLDLMLPICMLNGFLVLMTTTMQENAKYLSNAITLGLTLAFFFETRSASRVVSGGDDDHDHDDDDDGDDDDGDDDDDDDDDW
jgi:hypothetical protein